MSKPFIVGITGCSGSGKTFFLKSFLNYFTEPEVTLISQDDYYVPLGEMTAEENRLYNFDLPSAINEELFLADIQSLLTGKSVFKEEYTFHNKNIKPRILELKPAPVLIIEGLFILHYPEIAKLPDMKIFIDTNDSIAFGRRLKRDLAERAYSREDISYKWHNHVLPSYREYLLPYKSHCHKIIDNNSETAESMLKIAEEISIELRKEILSKRT